MLKMTEYAKYDHEIVCYKTMVWMLMIISSIQLLFKCTIAFHYIWIFGIIKFTAFFKDIQVYYWKRKCNNQICMIQQVVAFVYVNLNKVNSIPKTNLWQESYNS